MVSNRRWLVVSAPVDGARYFARAVWQAVTNFLAIAGTVAIVFGLLYRFAAGSIPHLLQAHGTLLDKGGVLLRGHSTAAADSHRATILLAAGALSLVAAWLIRPRRKS
jgi:MYXO-CTERM domain-containing protein